MTAFKEAHRGNEDVEYMRGPLYQELKKLKKAELSLRSLVNSWEEAQAERQQPPATPLSMRIDLTTFEGQELVAKVMAGRLQEAIHKLRVALSHKSHFLGQKAAGLSESSSHGSELTIDVAARGKINQKLAKHNKEIKAAKALYNEIAGAIGKQPLDDQTFKDVESALEDGDLDQVYNVLGLPVATDADSPWLNKEVRCAVHHQWANAKTRRLMYAALRFERGREELARIKYEVQRMLRYQQYMDTLLHDNYSRLKNEGDLLLAVQERANLDSFRRLHAKSYYKLCELYQLHYGTAWSWPNIGMNHKLEPQSVLFFGNQHDVGHDFPVITSNDDPQTAETAPTDPEEMVDAPAADEGGGEDSEDEAFQDQMAWDSAEPTPEHEQLVGTIEALTLACDA